MLGSFVACKTMHVGISSANCMNLFDLHIFFRFSINFSIYTDVIQIAASAQLLTTSHFRSRIEYLIPTYNILVFYFTRKFDTILAFWQLFR